MTDAHAPGSTLVRPIPLGQVNAFLIRGERPVLVDTGLPGSAPVILAALEDEGYRPQDLALIVITHLHTDHFGSAAALSAATGAPVLVHGGEAEFLARGEGLPPVPVSLMGRIFSLLIGRQVPVPDLAIAPAIRVTSPYRLDVYGIDGEVIPTPGHTRGSLSVRLASGEFIAGDLVTGILPAHRPRPPLFAEDIPAARKSIRMVLDKGPEIIYAGHGGPFTPGQLEFLTR